MFKFIKKHKKSLSLLLAIAIFINMHYPYLNVLAEDSSSSGAVPSTTETQLAPEGGGATQPLGEGAVQPLGGGGAQPLGGGIQPLGTTATFKNFEYNIVLQKVVSNAGEENEVAVNLSTKDEFNKAHITIETPLNIKIDTKIKSTIRKDDIIDIALPDYPLDLTQFESNEYTESGFSYKIQTGADGKKHLILKCLDDIELSSQPAEYILKLPTTLKIDDKKKTKVDIPFNNGTTVLTVNIAPKGITSSIQKDGIQEANSIRWFIYTNLFSETISNFDIKETIPEQVIFNDDTTITVKKLKVDLDGNKEVTDEVISNVSKSIAGSIATISVNQQIDSPIIIEFVTPVKPEILTSSNPNTNIKNIVAFDGTVSEKTVSFKPADMLEKTHEAVNFNDDKISWKLTLNSAKTVIEDNEITITETMTSKKKEINATNPDINSDEYTIDMPTKVTIKNIDKGTSREVIPIAIPVPVPVTNGKIFKYTFQLSDNEKKDTFEITYDTPVNNKLTNIQTKSLIENIATTTLSSKQHSVIDSATIIKSMHIKKSVGDILKTADGYKATWKIYVNFDKQNIAPAVNDNMTLSPTDSVKILKDSFKVYEVTPQIIEQENHPDYRDFIPKYTAIGQVASEKYTISEITDTTTNFNISFNEQSNKSYVLTYDTILDSPNDVVNTAILDGISAVSILGGTTHNRIYKDRKTHTINNETVYDDLDMGNKTMVFYIYVEPNRAPMENIVIDDTFVNKGLTIKKENIEFLGETITDDDYTFEEKADPKDGFVLKIKKPITKRLTIKTTAKFSRNDNITTDKTIFLNQINSTWKDKYNETNSKTTQAEYKIPKELFEKAYGNNSNISGTLHGGTLKDRQIDWTTNINYAGESLPPNTTVKIYPIKQDSPDSSTQINQTYHKINDNFKIYPYTLTKEGDIKYDTVHPLVENKDYSKVSDGDGSYTITFTNPITQGYSIRYSSKIETEYSTNENTDPKFDIDNKTKFKMKNEITVPSSTPVNIAAVVDTKIRDVFEKKGAQNKLNAFEILYTAVFNKIAEKVPAGTYIYDVLSEEQVFIPESLIMTYSNGTVVPKEDYVIDYSVDLKARHIMSIKFTKDITEPVNIIYRTHVNNEHATELKNVISYKEDPSDSDVNNGSRITFKRRGSGKLIIPKGASVININYTNETCCKDGKCPVFPSKLNFEIFTKDTASSTETLYKTVSVGINTTVPVNISANKLVKVRLKQDPTAEPRLREFESDFKQTVADKETNFKYDVSLNEYKLNIKFTGDIRFEFNPSLAPDLKLQKYDKNFNRYEDIDSDIANHLKNVIKNNGEYTFELGNITEDMIKNSTTDLVKLELNTSDPRSKNYSYELVSINGERVSNSDVNAHFIELDKCAENRIEVNISSFKKHRVTLRQWTAPSTGVDFTDNTANNKTVAISGAAYRVGDTETGNSFLFNSIPIGVYDILLPNIPYYIKPELETDFINPNQTIEINKIDTSRSSFMTQPTATNTDALYKKAKKLIINKKEVIRNYDGTDTTNTLDRDVTFTLTDKTDSNIKATFTVNAHTQTYKVVEDNSNIIDVQGNVLYVKEGQYTLTEKNMNSVYFYGYIDQTTTNNLPSTTINKTSVDVDLSASVTDVDISQVIYNHKDYNSLKITKTGDGSHPVTGTKIGLFTAVNGGQGTKIAEKVVGTDGTVIFDNISDYQYGYKELVAPDGYVLDTNFYPITRPNNTSALPLGRVEPINLVNHRIKSKVVISKKDASRDKYFSGVSFILQGTNENSQDVSNVKIQKDTARIGDIAQAKWDDLEVGTYKLYEKVPEGYKIPQSYVSTDTVDNHIFTGYKIQITDNKKIYTVDDNNKATGKTVPNEKSATTILNTALTLSFDVKKTSADDDRSDKNNLPLQGVQYTLTEKTNSNILGKFSKTVTTNQDGIARFENIPVGEYELIELAPIDPYKKDTAVTTVKVENDNGTAKLMVNAQEDTDKVVEKTNSVDYGTIKITKTAGTQRVNNVKFTIKYIADISKVPATFVNGKTAPAITQISNPNFVNREYTVTTATVDSENGVIKQKLPKGIYVITEVEAPQGYKLSDPYYVKIDGNNSITPLTINNEVEKVKLSILKKDADDNRLIKGAKFEIERKNNIDGSYDKLKNTDNSTIFTTNADGKIEVNVQKGAIRITEVTAAPHYDINSLKLYDTAIEDSKKISGEIPLTSDKTIIATNTKIKSKFVLTKKNVTRDGNSVNFADVVFKLYESDENYTKLDNTADYTFTTGIDGKIEGEINTGYYVIEETRKAGYTSNIVVKDNATPLASSGLTFKKDINADTDITVENKPIYVKFKITKVQEGTTTPVPGATVAIFDKNDTKIAEATSGADGVMNYVATYQNAVFQYNGILWQEGLFYKELNRPNGYFINNDKHLITLQDDPSLNDSTISYTLGNEQIQGEIKVITYSRNKLTNAESNIGNVKVELEKFDGTSWKKIREAITDTKGEFVFRTLEEGKYRVVEKYASNTEVLKGYEQVDKTATTEKGGSQTQVEIKPVSADGSNTQGVTNHTLYIPHEAFFGSLTINKKDTDGNKLTGVVFGLYNDSDTKIDTLTTNEGTIKKENLIFGNYYIKEESTPNNILIDESKIDFSINYANRDVVKEIVNDKFNATIEVSVVDKETNEPIDNTEISTNTLGKKTTGTTGQISYTNVPKGTHEISISKVNPNYLPNPTVEKVELKDADNNKVVKIIYKLTKIRTGIILTKTDEKTGEVLQGVEFELVGTKSGNTTAVVKTTDEQGRVIFDNLIYDTYVIKETQTKDEYRLLDDTITVELNQENLTLNVKNTKKTGLLEFVKVDKNSQQPLKNAHIEIYKENEKVASFVTNNVGTVETVNTTDNNIYVTKDQVTNKNQVVMPIGKYSIKEIQAPSGYDLSTEVVEFEVELDTVATVTLENTPSPIINHGGGGGGGGGSDKPRKPDPLPLIPSIPQNPNPNTPNNNTPNNGNPNNNTPNNNTPNNGNPNNNTPNSNTPNNGNPNNNTPNTSGNIPNIPTGGLTIKIYEPIPNYSNTTPNQNNNPIPDSTTANNQKDKSNIENVKKAVESRKVYQIVDKNNRPIGNAVVVVRDNKLELEFIEDQDVPASGTIRYDEDDNTIEVIDNEVPLSGIYPENKILPRTGDKSSQAVTIIGIALIILALLLRLKNRKR